MSASWIDQNGQVFPLNGKSHSEFAYEILLNEKLGEHMSPQMPTDGTLDQKGKSGEVAKADAMRELGSPDDPKHSAELAERGWVQARATGGMMVLRAAGLESIRHSWCTLASIGSAYESVVFAFKHSGSGVSAGLSGKTLAEPAELVIARIAEMARSKANSVDAKHWPHGHGVKYFE